MKNFSKINYLVVGLTSMLIFSGCGKIVDTYPVDVLKNETTTSPTVTTTTPSIPSAEKIMVTSADWREHDAELAKQVDDGSFKGAVNTDAATTTTHYIDFKNGFEVDLPYNPNWGINNLVPVSYEATTTQVDFGPLVVICMGSCETGRDYQLTVLPHTKTATEINTELRDNASTTKKIMVGNITVLDKYPAGDTDCISVNLEFTTNNHTYNLNSSCFGNAASDREILLNVIKSMKFFDPKKIVIDEHNVERFSEQYCPEEFSHQVATKFVTYVNKGKGISFIIPYNPEWKFKEFVLAPYFDYPSSLEFGPTFFDLLAGCGPNRMFQLDFLPVKSREEIIKQITATLSQKQIDKMSQENVTINNLPVLKIIYGKSPQHDEGEYACPKLIDVYVFGKKSNYYFHGVDCIGSSFGKVEDVIKTMKLIE